MLLCNARFQAYELSFKPLCDLFDWWERAVGSLAASFLAEQQADLQEDKATKKGKKPTTGFFKIFCFVAVLSTGENHRDFGVRHTFCQEPFGGS